jgi:hypothetical protein
MESNSQSKYKNGTKDAAMRKLTEALKHAKKVRRFSWLKPKMSIEKFCESLFGNRIFFSTYECAEDMRSIFWSEIFNSLVKIDNDFQHIVFTKNHGDFEIATHEMIALQIELFGLAWMHHFRLERYHGFEEKYILGEIVFTKNYMAHNGCDDIWNIMSYYNKTIADALLHPCVKATDRAFSPLTAVKDEIPCYIIDRKFTKKLRDDIDNWRKEVGLDCATRVVNRISKREDWGGRPIALMLTMTFAERMGWKVDLRDEGFAGFERFLNRLYNDFKQEIELVEIR